MECLEAGRRTPAVLLDRLQGHIILELFFWTVVLEWSFSEERTPSLSSFYAVSIKSIVNAYVLFVAMKIL